MDLYTKLSTSMEELAATFSTRMAQYEEDLRNAGNDASTHKSIASLSREFTEFKSLIWKTMSTFKVQIELLVLGLDRHEMASRSMVLLLHGLPADKIRQPVDQLLGVLAEKLGMPDISPTQITKCHYLGTNVNKPRPMLVRFESRLLRAEVWRKKTMLKGSGITISEFLTKPRHEVFTNARKYYGVNRCWTSEGKIVIQVTDKARKKIESAAELRSLMSQFPVASSPVLDSAVPVAKTSQPQHKPVSQGTDKRPRKAVK